MKNRFNDKKEEKIVIDHDKNEKDKRREKLERDRAKRDRKKER